MILDAKMEIHVKPRPRGPHMDWPFLAVHFFLNDLNPEENPGSFAAWWFQKTSNTD